VTTSRPALDPILDIRLTLLDQAGAEAAQVIQMMTEQRDKLADVEQYLCPDGKLHDVEKHARMIIGDSRTRLLALNGTLAGRLTPTDEGMLRETLDLADRATELVDSLAKSRAATHERFQGITRWSVAGLEERTLQASRREYAQLIRSIRQDTHPWARYTTEMRGGGHELITHYLQLLGGMAVRGFGLDADVMSDVSVLVKQLETPLSDNARSAIGMRSPMAALGDRHVPLGYPEWSLWALPLVGRTVGDKVVSTGAVTKVAKGLPQALCADAYALFVLGPCYPYAAIYLEMNPGADVDDVRVRVLLDRLRSAVGPDGPSSPVATELAGIADSLGAAWDQARTSCTGRAADTVAADTVDPNHVAAVDEFLDELKREYPDLAYSPRTMARAQELSGVLTDLTADLTGQNPPMLQLVTAIWFARLRAPDQAEAIHQRAKTLARNEPDRRLDSALLNSGRRLGAV
jgi:hypothetical protein